MISRVTMRKSGLADYLMTGKRADSELLREEKDNAIPLYGSLKLLKKAEHYCNEKKNWNANYEHITISFSEKDEKILNSLTLQDKREALQDIALTMIKHRTSGYDLENEVIAYAEVHSPKIKKEVSPRTGHTKTRREHIHIGISYLNLLTDTKLQTTFYNNSYISDTIDKYIAKKHGLTFVPEKEPDDNNIDKSTDMSINRATIKEAVKDFTTKEELYSYLDANDIKYDFTNMTSKTKHKNIYIYNDKGGKIHLRGKDFPNIEIMHNDKMSDNDKRSYIKELKNKSLKELGDILEDYYKTQRIPRIEERRSKKTEQLLKDIYRQYENYADTDRERVFQSFQEKIFYKHYDHLVTSNLSGYSVDTKDNLNVSLINKERGIRVYDRGDKIISHSTNKSNEEEVKLMIDISLAKGWELSELDITGDRAFRKEAFKQIAEHYTKKDKETNKTLSLQKETAVIKGLERPKTPVQQLAKENKEEKEAKATPLSELKKLLKAQAVLDHAVKVYKLDPSQFEITADNKINNLGNRAKPKNVIDFLQKEINLTSKEAITECQELYKEQPLEIQTVDIDMPEMAEAKVKKEPIKLKERKKENEYTREQRATALHRSTDRENGNSRSTRGDLSRMSDSDMVLSGKSRSTMLLQGNERDSIQFKREADSGMQSSRARDFETQGQDGERRARGGVSKMPLSVSINKTGQKNALTGWEVSEVKGYSELASLMKQGAYSMAQFEKKKDANNIKHFNNILIYDIDNDPKSKHLTIHDAKKLLEGKGVPALILPSKSHQIEKFTDSGKSKGIADRYRIVIPTKTAIKSDTDKEIFAEFQNLTSKALGIDKYVDNQAMRDIARYYYPSPIEAAPLISKADKVMDISNLESKAIENVQAKRAEKEAQLEKMREIRANLAAYRVVSMPESNNLTYVDAEEIIQAPITPVIDKWESVVDQKEEGSYKYLTTNTAKYSIIDDNVAHDFKSDTTFNTLTYLQMQEETKNLNVIARSLSKTTGEDYIKTNVSAVKTALTDGLKTAKNDKELEAKMRERFGCAYAKLGKDSIKIADRNVKLSDLDTDKLQIINAFRENRELAQSKEKAQEQGRGALKL